MELLRIADIMARYGIGRARATEWAELSGAALPRRKGQTYLIDAAKLAAWLKRRAGK